MTKFDWSRAQRRMPHNRITALLDKAADRFLAQREPPKPKRKKGYVPPLVQRGHQRTQQLTSRDIWITQGADSPNNPTGERQTHHFASVNDAHKAGFSWIR